MNNLSDNKAFKFIANMFSWDSVYSDHMAYCYSSYADVNSAIRAICDDYDLNYSEISNAVSSENSVSPIRRVMTDDVCDRILSLILNSQAPEIKRRTRMYRDMSCYKLLYAHDDVYDCVYKNYESGYTVDIVQLNLELDCLARNWRAEQLRKRNNKYRGWVNLYDRRAIVYFTLEFNT